MAGLTVCRAHGGAAHRERGLRVIEGERITRRAGAALVALGIDREGDVDPVAVLLGALRQSTLTAEALAGLLESEDRLTGESGERPSVLVELWNGERDRAANMAATAIRAGIAERVVRMTEAQGVRIIDAVTAALRDPAWGLSDDQRAIGQRIIAAHFRRLARP